MIGVTSGSSLFTAAYFFGVTIYFKTFWKPWYYNSLNFVTGLLEIFTFLESLWSLLRCLLTLWIYIKPLPLLNTTRNRKTYFQFNNTSISKIDNGMLNVLVRCGTFDNVCNLFFRVSYMHPKRTHYKKSLLVLFYDIQKFSSNGQCTLHVLYHLYIINLRFFLFYVTFFIYFPLCLAFPLILSYKGNSFGCWQIVFLNYFISERFNNFICIT